MPAGRRSRKTGKTVARVASGPSPGHAAVYRCGAASLPLERSRRFDANLPGQSSASGCVDQVCSVFPSCCDLIWDTFCVEMAIGTCTINYC